MSADDAERQLMAELERLCDEVDAKIDDEVAGELLADIGAGLLRLREALARTVDIAGIREGKGRPPVGRAQRELVAWILGEARSLADQLKEAHGE